MRYIAIIVEYIILLIALVFCSNCALGNHSLDGIDSGVSDSDEVVESNEQNEIVELNGRLDIRQDVVIDNEPKTEPKKEQQPEIEAETEPKEEEENEEPEPEEEPKEKGEESEEEGEPEEVPELDAGVDSGFDAGTPDTGSPDSGFDAGTPDTGQPDTGAPDTSRPDTGQPDTGNPDTGTVDSGVQDSGEIDSGEVDSGEVDSGQEPTCTVTDCNPIDDTGDPQQIQSFASVETLLCTDGVDEWEEQYVCDYSDECMDRKCMPCLEEHAGSYTTLELDGGDEVVIDCLGCKCYLWWRVDNSVRCPKLFPKIVSFEPGLYIRDLTMSFQVTVTATGSIDVKSTAPGTVVTEYVMSDFEHNVGYSAIFDLWVVGYVDGRPFEVNTNLAFVCL